METLIKQEEISEREKAELTLEAIRIILENVLKRISGRFKEKLELRLRTEEKTFGPSGTIVFIYKFYQLAKVKGFLFKTRESIITSGPSNPKKKELVFEVFDHSVVKDLKQDIDNSDFFKKFEEIQPVILEK